MKTYVITLEDLRAATNLKMSCIDSNNTWSRPIAAAMIFSMQGRVILRYIENGLEVYEPKTKDKWLENNRKGKNK